MIPEPINPNLENMYSYGNISNTGVDITYKMISTEGLFIIGIGVLIIAIYIVLYRDKEKYSKWINKKGHEVNLIRLMRIILYSYTALVVAGFLIQKFFFGG